MKNNKQITQLIINNIKTEYTITEDGKIYKPNGEIVNITTTPMGYAYTSIQVEGVPRRVTVHRAVACSFIKNRKNLPCVNHIDGNKQNNHKSNLEWCTYSYNNKHALDLGLRVPLKGEDHQYASLTNEQVIRICELLQSGMIYDEIVKTLNLGHIENIRIKIKMIKTGNAWISIAKDYTFPVSRNQPRVYSDELVHKICRLFESGERSYNRILEKVGLVKTTKTEKLVSCIFNRTRHKKISNQYMW